nr:reverse transcriptase domain-containing protein [Tanacetum cinerariifolium]
MITPSPSSQQEPLSPPLASKVALLPPCPLFYPRVHKHHTPHQNYFLDLKTHPMHSLVITLTPHSKKLVHHTKKLRHQGVMSSPNHPTSDIEDAFSSNSPNYTSTSPDYSPASPGTQAANMENADNTNRNPELREVLVARKCSYKEFMRSQPFNFKGSKGAIGFICWFERTESVFSRSNCTKDYKVKFATGGIPLLNLLG